MQMPLTSKAQSVHSWEVLCSAAGLCPMQPSRAAIIPPGDIRRNEPQEVCRDNHPITPRVGGHLSPLLTHAVASLVQRLSHLYGVSGKAREGPRTQSPVSPSAA